ncbi:SRCAP, partial [Symbiodinium necroappetens]
PLCSEVSCRSIRGSKTSRAPKREDESYEGLFSQAAGTRSWETRLRVRGQARQTDDPADQVALLYGSPCVSDQQKTCAGQRPEKLARGIGRGLCSPSMETDKSIFNGYAGTRSRPWQGPPYAIDQDALPQAAQVRRAAQAVLRVEAKRRAVAKKAAKQVQALLRQLQRNEASRPFHLRQRLEEEQRAARAGDCEVLEWLLSSSRVQQRHAARTQQHFENMQALLSRSEAFSSEAPREGLEKEPQRAYFRGQLAGLIRSNPQLDFCFLQGHLPAEVAPEASGAWNVVLRPHQRQAWQYFSLRNDPGAEDPAKRWRAGHDTADGLEHVWEDTVAEVTANGPFFATVGFSQGANVAAALLAKQACSKTDLGFRCTVNLCGGIWGFWDKTPRSWWSSGSPPQLPIRGVPSLHILGRADPYLAQSRYLVESYVPCEGRRVLEHEGGHTPFPFDRDKRLDVIRDAQNSLEELERSPRLHYEDFDRRNMSKQITTEVPVLLLRHPIREYQHIGGHPGLHWLATLHDKQFNGILADEMGLGKTIMTIALLAHLAVQNLGSMCLLLLLKVQFDAGILARKEVWGPHLVVVPTSLLMNWVKELQKWAPALQERRDKRRGWGGEDAFHVCVASYTVVLQDLRPLPLDRSNYRSQKWQQLMRFKSERRLLLTGTPLQNNLTELWSLLHFLMPDMFQSYTDFKEFFADPLHLALHEHRVKQEQELRVELVARLHKVIRPFLLRRLKSEVERQLPKKHEHVVSCPLSRRQQVLYEEFMRRRQTQQILKKGKVCNHPELLEPRGADTSFVMNPLAVNLPPLVSLDLWLNVAGRISLWKFELMLKTQSHKALPISEVVEMSLDQAPKRRRVSEAAAELRCQVSPGSREFLDEWHLQMCRVDEERKRERCSAVSAVDLLMQLVSEGRPWIGADGMELLSLPCRSGTAFSLTKRLPPRPFMWPELQRSSSIQLSPASRQLVLPEERRRKRRCWSWELDGALAAMSCSILRDLESNVATRLGMWAFRVPRVQVSSSGSAFGEPKAANTKDRLAVQCCLLPSPMELTGSGLEEWETRHLTWAAERSKEIPRCHI